MTGTHPRETRPCFDIKVGCQPTRSNKSTLKYTYKIVVLTAHGVGAASNIDNVDRRAVYANRYGDSTDQYADGGEEKGARGRGGLNDSEQACASLRMRYGRIRTVSSDWQDWRSGAAQELAGVDVDAGCQGHKIISIELQRSRDSNHTAVTVTVVVVAGGEPLGMAAARITKVMTTAKLREMVENIVDGEKTC